MKPLKIYGNEDKIKKIKEAYKNFLSKKSLKDIINIVISFKGNKYSVNNYFMAYMYYDFLRAINPDKYKNFEGSLKGFKQWNKDNIRVLKGYEGLPILIPLYYNIDYSLNKKFLFKFETYILKDIHNDIYTFVSEDNKTIARDKSQLPETKLSGFKLGCVFDISETNKYADYLKEKKTELEEKNEKIYKNLIELNFDDVYNFVINNYDKNKILFDLKEIECKGFYSIPNKNITLHNKDSHTLLHEYSHYLTINLIKDSDKHQYEKREILAELCSYLISLKFSNDINYNFNYSNCWSSHIDYFDFLEFEKYYNQINKIVEKLDFKIKVEVLK